MRRLTPAILALLLFAGAPDQQEKPAENPEKRMAPSKMNAAAEELESLVLALGLDPHRRDPASEHPSREDVDAYDRAGFGSWLDAQLKTTDDSIASVPATFRSFLEQRQPTLWRVVGVLQRDVPQWDLDPRGSTIGLPLLVLSQLARILTAAALVEERAGHPVQAGDLLDSTWSLSRSLSERPELISQLIAVAIGRLQAGALRKMSEPPIQWLDRMSAVEPWRGMLDAFDAEHQRPARDEAVPDESAKTAGSAWRAVTDRLKELSPCEVAKLSEEEIWKPAQDELDRRQEAKGDSGPKSVFAFALPNLTSAIRRAGRLLVDREMTARILELRQERAASRDGRWPEKFSHLDSSVCPGSFYEYLTRGAAMAIRFKGPIDDGGGPPLVLPTSFEVRAPRPTPTATRARPTVTPRPRS